MHHHTIQINHQPDATIFQFIILTFIYSSTCFGRSPAHHQELSDCSGSLWFYLRIVVTAVLCSWLGRLANRSNFRHQASPRVSPRESTQRRKVELWERNVREFCLNAHSHVTFRDLLYAVKLRHGTDGFTSPPKEGVLRIFFGRVRTRELGNQRLAR